MGKKVKKAFNYQIRNAGIKEIIYYNKYMS
jgi:hypothetical protein